MTTSRKVARTASSLLRSNTTGTKTKQVAGSALSQAAKSSSKTTKGK